MNKNIEKFNALIDVVGKATIHPACEEFNILDEVRVDENAHTRILAGLLREKTLRCQFLEMIRREVSMRSETESGDGQCGCIENLMSDANIANVADNGIRVFSKYIDALIISPNNFAVIIENKVKGAEDQDRQVERYIETVKDSEGLDVKRIIVVYLTRDGGDPSENSLSPETRAELGAYLPLNYEKHILHWLKHGLTFTFDEISDKQGLMSAIRQYAGFLEKRLGLNAETDPYVSLVDQVQLALGEANPYLLLGHATQMILARRTYVCGAQSSSEADKRFFEAYGSSEAEGVKGEKQQMLKCLFYGRLDETVADDDDNRFVEKYTNFALSMTATLPAQTGLAYVDFFWESGDSDDYCRKRDVFLDALVSVGYEKGCIIDDLIYHNVNYVRCVVNRPSDIFKFHDALKSACSVELHPIHDSASSVHMSADILSLLRLQVVLKKLIARMDDVDRERFGALADDRSTHYFYGHNKWAWQRSPWNNYGMAAVEVFPHRDADEKAFWRYLTESNGGYPYWIYRWNGGRIVYQFPIAADDGYERRLTKFLSDWQLDKVPCLQCVDSWSCGVESA